MTELFASFGEVFKTYIWQPISGFTLWDALDILLLTVLLYGLFIFLKGRRAVKLAVGLAVVALLYVLSDVMGLRAIHQLIAWITPFFVILLAIIFQPEIRDGLERLGDKPFGFLMRNKDEAETAKVISEVVDAACHIAQTAKDGALIVIERSTPLGDFVERGHAMDAAVSSELLRNIFVDGTPLHDGAVIIRNNRIAAACCELPLTTNDEVVKGLGSRHRAAVGISEVSDCVVVVVSEQRHVISIANNKFLKRNYNQKADEFQNEVKAKAIQKALRKDLARLLQGDTRSGDTEDGDGEGKNRRIVLPEIHFIWSLKDKKPTGGKSAVSEADPKSATGASSPRSKNRYRVVEDKPVEPTAAPATDGQDDSPVTVNEIPDAVSSADPANDTSDGAPDGE